MEITRRLAGIFYLDGNNVSPCVIRSVKESKSLVIQSLAWRPVDIDLIFILDSYPISKSTDAVHR
jgi:hypothetical protein